MNEHRLLQTLADRGLTIGSVESITAGLFASDLASIPGASAVLKGAMVTYVAEEKIALAGVGKSTIDHYGVVSPEVAAEMAIGGKRKLGVDMCISCTGNAGPTVEKGDKPVGCVYLGLAYKDLVYTAPLQLEGDRNSIREQVAEAMVAFGLSLFPEENEK